MRKILVLLLTSFTISYSQIYLDSTASINTRVDDLLSRMTVQEKIGQMIQVDKGNVTATKNDITGYYIGSLLSGGGSVPSQNNPISWANMYDDFQSYALKTRLKIPLIYGIDAVHGHNNVFGATIFPHNIGLGATKNEKLVRMADSIVALEVAATGIDWTFAPCIAVVRNERWGRTYEGFGESPELSIPMARASVLGFQGEKPFEKNRILACAKHYLADGGTSNGTNEGNSIMTEAELRKIHLPGFIEAIKQSVGSIMPSYSSWNGVKMHGNKYLLTDVLKTELGFSGFVISDWAGIDQLPGSYRDDVKQSINAGIDMVMIPDRYQLFSSTLAELINTGEVPISRIDDAVKRILRKKFELGLFEKPYADRSLLPLVGSHSHREVARQSVRESIVLLKKKDGILPLKKSGQKILVSGKGGNDIGMQCGGWTITWQGSMGNITTGTTVYSAIQKVVGSNNVAYDRNAAVTSGFDAAVVVIGETPYAESAGDKSDLSLDAEDINTVRKLKEAGLKTIVILFSGRPMIINSIIPFSDAIIAAWLPGTEGFGITDVLFGDYHPKGTLSHSWPRSMAQIPINFGDTNYDPLFKLDYGILSLQESQVGASPQYYSSVSTNEGNSIEVAFTKQMKLTTGAENSFLIKINNVAVSITNIKIKEGDPKNIVINLSKSIVSGDKATLQILDEKIISADNGVLKPFGPEEVLNFAQKQKILSIPGKIEAEDYTSMFGIQTEGTIDTGGGTNVGYIDNGDWLEYQINISTSGSYNSTFRVASQPGNGTITLKLDGKVLGSIDVSATGGWQNWKSINMLVDLIKGDHLLRIEAPKGGYNINWMNFDIFSNVNEEIISEYKLEQNYPNPFNPTTTIKYELPIREFVTIKLFNSIGQEIGILMNEQKSAGRHEFVFNGTRLASGVYYYRIQAGDIIQTKKMLLIK